MWLFNHTHAHTHLPTCIVNSCPGHTFKCPYITNHINESIIQWSLNEKKTILKRWHITETELLKCNYRKCIYIGGRNTIHSLDEYKTYNKISKWIGWSRFRCIAGNCDETVEKLTEPTLNPVSSMIKYAVDMTIESIIYCWFWKVILMKRNKMEMSSYLFLDVDNCIRAHFSETLKFVSQMSHLHHHNITNHKHHHRQH